MLESRIAGCGDSQLSCKTAVSLKVRSPKSPKGRGSLLSVFLLSLALMAQLIPLSFATSTPIKNIVNADLIRVGISDDGMTALEYPQARISSNGPFTVVDKSTGLPILSAQAGEVITFTVNSAGFTLKSNIQHDLKLMAPKPNAKTAKLLTQKAAITEAPVPEGNNLAVPPQVAPAGLMPVPGTLRIEPVNPASRLKVMSITRRKEIPEFRGAIEIVRAQSSPNKLSVVNELWMEDYLKAVVPNELPMRYGWEAVKAQSVAARNYAIHPREKPWKAFDICDSQLCQVYFGSQTETPDSNRAIASTQGMLALYEGKPILALFSSSHGGYAEDYANAFSDPVTKQYPAPSIPYLTGGPDIPLPGSPDLRTETGARHFWTDPSVQSFDVESPYYRWTKTWARTELETGINQGLLEVSQEGSTKAFITPLFQPGDSLGAFKSVQVLERGVSGKAMIVKIEGSKGAWTIQKEFLIRKVFKKDGRMLPSANVVFSLQKDSKGHFTGLSAQGGGFGHGVGLSQLGASWMNKHGFAFPQIIQHYYKGVSLGCLPITVGGNKPARPVMTHFGASQPRATLWVVEETPESSWMPFHKAAPVELQLNGKPIHFPLTTDRGRLAVDGFINSGELNTLVLLPDEKHPERKVKAWVELYPPQAILKSASTEAH
jgi:SpoIID/LytB domain protein